MGVKVDSNSPHLMRSPNNSRGIAMFSTFHASLLLCHDSQSAGLRRLPPHLELLYTSDKLLAVPIFGL